MSSIDLVNKRLNIKDINTFGVFRDLNRSFNPELDVSSNDWDKIFEQEVNKEQASYSYFDILSWIKIISPEKFKSIKINESLKKEYLENVDLNNGDNDLLSEFFNLENIKLLFPEEFTKYSIKAADTFSHLIESLDKKFSYSYLDAVSTYKLLFPEKFNKLQINHTFLNNSISYINNTNIEDQQGLIDTTLVNIKIIAPKRFNEIKILDRFNLYAKNRLLDYRFENYYYRLLELSANLSIIFADNIDITENGLFLKRNKLDLQNNNLNMPVERSFA